MSQFRSRRIKTAVWRNDQKKHHGRLFTWISALSCSHYCPHLSTEKAFFRTSPPSRLRLGTRADGCRALTDLEGLNAGLDDGSKDRFALAGVGKHVRDLVQEAEERTRSLKVRGVGGESSQGEGRRSAALTWR